MLLIMLIQVYLSRLRLPLCYLSQFIIMLFISMPTYIIYVVSNPIFYLILSYSFPSVINMYSLSLYTSVVNHTIRCHSCSYSLPLSIYILHSSYIVLVLSFSLSYQLICVVNVPTVLCQFLPILMFMFSNIIDVRKYTGYRLDTYQYRV